MKKILKYTLIVLLSFIGFIVLYLCAAWVLSRIPVAVEPGVSQEVPFFLQSNGVHTDIIIPARTAIKDWTLSIPYSNTRSGDTTLQYLAFGWGDKGFYLETPTWADLKARVAFNAAFGFSSSAIHATFHHEPVINERCVKSYMSTEQYGRLIAFIENSLPKNAAGLPIVIPTEARYGQHDAFYESKGSYHLFHTCNTWTNNALKACGQKACLWTPFDKGILYQYRH